MTQYKENPILHWVNKHSNTIVILTAFFGVFVWMDSKFDKINDKFDKINDKFDRIDDKFASIERRIGDVENRLVKIETILYIKGLISQELATQNKEECK